MTDEYSTANCYRNFAILKLVKKEEMKGTFAIF